MSDAIPEPLRSLTDLVNTDDLADGSDDLADVAGLAAWLREHGLLEDDDAQPSPRDLARSHALRAAARELLRANHDDREPAAEALATLREEAARVGLGITLDGGGGAALTATGTGFDAAVARLLAAVVLAQADGSWSRLKVCSNSTCQWAFYDRSRNRSGRWCDMAVCGNRAKVRRYRERQADDA